jgi:subtilisin-like proprotein convertase family protein
MKRITLVTAVVVLALSHPLRADFVQTFNTGFANGGVIPDGSLTGWSDTETLSGAPASPITDLSVTLNLSGGWNGDLYAYLVHGSGFAVLLNRVGSSAGNNAGYGDAGMNVVFSDAAPVNIHSYGGGGVPTGSYAPDGRNISPLSGGGAIAATTPTALLSSFNGLNAASGSWTLFLADVSAGDVSTVTSWALDIASVPEPRSVIEGTLAALFMGGLIAVYRFKHVFGLRPS